MKRPTNEAPIDDSNRDVLICFSHLRWNFVYQRPQHLMSRAARTHRVLFFEEPLFEQCALPHLRLRADISGVTIVEPILPLDYDSTRVVLALRSLLDELIEQHSGPPSIAWYYTPMALEFSRHIRSARCIYDNMDELSAFRGASTELLKLEQELLARADAVFTGGHSLYRSKRHQHENIHPMPSSVDVAHFSTARRLKTECHDQAALLRPRLGFFGVIDERMNLELVADIARCRPHWQLVMIGPVAKIDPNSLPRSSNIAWLGMKSYNELPSYLSGWDVGIMPFARNESTKYISPTKTPEFLAAGVPVICTSIADVVDPYGKLGLALIADDASGFVTAAEKLLGRSNSRWLAEVDRHLAGCSWDKTWSAMTDIMQRPRSKLTKVPRKSHENDLLHV